MFHALLLGCLAGAASLVQAPARAQEPPRQAPANVPAAASVSTSTNEADAEPRFAIHEFEVEGNSVLSTLAIEAAVLPFLGDGRAMGDVEAARAALEKAYQAAGYLTVFVDVPEQRLDDAVVRLRVTEGRVERLRVTGSRWYDQGFIRDKLPALTPGGVPDFNAVQTEISAVTRDERRVQPVLRPGVAPGTVEVELKVTDKLPLSASIELNNRHAADTDPWRVQATLRYDNLFQRDHGIALTAITAPREPSQSKVLVANYSMPLQGGWAFAAYAVASDSVVEPLGAALVFGKGTTLGARWLRSHADAQSTHTLGFGFDIKNLKERVVAGSDALSTPLRYAPLQVSYTGSWPAADSGWSLNTTFVAALRSLLQRRIACPGNIGMVDQFACKREGADGGFAYLRGDLRHTRRFDNIPGEWAARLGWQLATQPLVSAEQFAAGGAETVRGYLEAEASGDHALLGSLEWRSPDFTPKKDSPQGSLLSKLQGLVFIDVARTNIQQPAAGQPGRIPLLGAGFGLRVRAGPGWSGEADLAWPHKRTRTTAAGDARLHLRVLGQF